MDVMLNRNIAYEFIEIKHRQNINYDRLYQNSYNMVRSFNFLELMNK
jgi:hypothetical protein